MTDQMTFNTGKVVLGNTISEQPSRDIERSAGLFRASAEDAFMYGGELTRYVLSTAPIQYDHKYVTIDVKTHMLFPGMIPAIPGWHTDGAPRPDPVYGQKQPSDLHKQLALSNNGESIKFHLLVSGTVSQTEFITESVKLDVPAKASRDLYADLNRQLNAIETLNGCIAPAWTWVTFDWWQLHRAVPANMFAWRYLIRITESDHIQPNVELRKVLRQQQQVYIMNEDYGW